MKVQRSKNSYLLNWFDYHDSSYSGFFGQPLLIGMYLQSYIQGKNQVDNIIFFSLEDT